MFLGNCETKNKNRLWLCKGHSKFKVKIGFEVADEVEVELVLNKLHFLPLWLGGWVGVVWKS